MGAAPDSRERRAAAPGRIAARQQLVDPAAGATLRAGRSDGAGCRRHRRARGAEDARIWVERGAHALNEAGERFTEALGLARRYPKAKVVFTGGAIEIIGSPKIGADAARAIFRDLGLVQGEQLLLEPKARDTWENAVLTKALVQPKPGERWLLVTSAWHMPRAVGVFRTAGFAVEPWPVDYRTGGPSDALRPFEAPADGLKRLDTAMREWIGLISYRASGRTDALFPGP